MSADMQGHNARSVPRWDYDEEYPEDLTIGFLAAMLVLFAILAGTSAIAMASRVASRWLETAANKVRSAARR